MSNILSYEKNEVEILPPLLEQSLAPIESIPLPPKKSAYNLPRNKAIANLFIVNGWSPHKIAEHYNVTVTTVWNVLKSPRVKEYIKELEGQIDEHFEKLFGKFVQTLSDAMDSPDPQIALAGAALYSKTAKRFQQLGGSGLSAEDVIQQLIQKHNELATPEERKLRVVER